MLFYHRFAVCLACTTALTLLSGCGGGVSGGEQTVLVDSVQISGVTFRVNSTSGSNTADGIEQPFATLQYALDRLRPGDKLLIEQSTIYSSTDVIGYDLDGRELQGFVISNSGAPGAPITIEGELVQGSASRPVIDQQQSGSNAANPAVMALYLNCASHIVIRNLEIRNANEAGISSAIDGSCETTDILVEGNYIHNIHGEKYVGGIRMMGVSNTVLRDNQIENVFSNVATQDAAMLSSGSGIENIVIEDNRLESLDVGVLVNAQGLGDPLISDSQEAPVTGLQIAHNHFSANVEQAISLQSHILDGAVTGKLQTGQFMGVDIYGNVFEQVNTVLLAELDDDDYQSESLCVFNNTVLESGSSVVGGEAAIMDVAGVSGLEIYNNIIINPQGDVLLTRAPNNAVRINRLDYSDHNLYLSSDILNWHLDAGGSQDAAYIDLASWQNANPHPNLSDALAIPDAASVLADPQFVDLPGGDYDLSPASPALLAGRFGMSIGADYQLPASVGLIANDCIARIR